MGGVHGTDSAVYVWFGGLLSHSYLQVVDEVLTCSTCERYREWVGQVTHSSTSGLLAADKVLSNSSSSYRSIQPHAVFCVAHCCVVPCVQSQGTR